MARKKKQREPGEIFLCNIKERIKRLGMTQVQAGEKAGFKYRQISQLLARTANPTLSTMVKMCAMVDQPVHVLLDPAYDPWGDATPEDLARLAGKPA